MPHAVERELAPIADGNKRYDVTVLCSLIDCEKLKKGWKEKYNKGLITIMEEAIEKTMSDGTTSYVQALVNAVDRHMELQYALDPRKIDFISIMDDIEMYIKGKSRIDIINAVTDAEVHVFGSAPEGSSWQQCLGGERPNVIIHEPVPYEQALEILQQTKILLNSSPWIKNGAHERIFSGLACGALVMTNDNIYLSEHFEDGKNIALYQNDSLNGVNAQVNEYLSDDAKRNAIVDAGRKLVMKEHTWDQRAGQLVKELGPILENIKEEMKKLKEKSEEKTK
jgi:glycosyltransferase involved in cell wall biosynthesis